MEINKEKIIKKGEEVAERFLEGINKACGDIENKQEKMSCERGFRRGAKFISIEEFKLLRKGISKPITAIKKRFERK